MFSQDDMTAKDRNLMDPVGLLSPVPNWGEGGGQSEFACGFKVLNFS